MASEVKEEIAFEIGHVLFIDIGATRSCRSTTSGIAARRFDSVPCCDMSIFVAKLLGAGVREDFRFSWLTGHDGVDLSGF